MDKNSLIVLQGLLAGVFVVVFTLLVNAQGHLLNLRAFDSLLNIESALIYTAPIIVAIILASVAFLRKKIVNYVGLIFYILMLLWSIIGLFASGGEKTAEVTMVLGIVLVISLINIVLFLLMAKTSKEQ